MTIAEAVLEKLQTLSVKEQEKVLAFAAALQSSARGARKPEDVPLTIWDKLLQLGRAGEAQDCDLPADLAANHDHYLHGLPKRT